MFTEDHQKGEALNRREPTQHNYFDDLARVLAGENVLSRRRALKLVGAVLLGGIFAGLLPGVGEAHKGHHGHHRHNGHKKHHAISSPPSPPPPSLCGDCAGCCEKQELGFSCQGGTINLLCGAGGSSCVACKLDEQCVPNDPSGLTGGSCKPIPTCPPEQIPCSTATGGCCPSGFSICCSASTGGGCCGGEFPVCCAQEDRAGCCSNEFPVCCPVGSMFDCCPAGTSCSPNGCD